ncbi:hypothetical protein [Luteolibacter soli]|uniref:Tail assembly chaperone n=1 Tax=Luteolibacter soli TaxID=3135280 RepID=A0ABU9AYI0_9BACT
MKPVTTMQAPVNAGDTPHLNPDQLKSFADELGFDVRDLRDIAQSAALTALLKEIEAGGEFTVPLTLCVVPSGKLPVFVDERRVRYLRECCAIADVDADKWVDEWIDTMVKDGLSGDYDVSFNGLTYDIVAEHGDRSPEEMEALYEKLRPVALKFQQEAKASLEGGAS